MLLSFCRYITRVPFFYYLVAFLPFPPNSPGSPLKGGQVSDESVLQTLWAFISTLHRPSSFFLLCCPQRHWHIWDCSWKHPTSKLRNSGMINAVLFKQLPQKPNDTEGPGDGSDGKLLAGQTWGPGSGCSVPTEKQAWKSMRICTISAGGDGEGAL